ncbi:MAG: hypothetical protein AABY93_02395 [Bacteroidota bacterium]
MSHVKGHVIDPPRSNGSLRPVQNDQPCPDLVIRILGNVGNDPTGLPINRGHFRNQKVGFHPTIDRATGYVWADDLVIWEAHEEAEAAVIADPTYNGKISSLEELHNKPALLKQLKKDISSGKVPDPHNVIAKTISYLATQDFIDIYLQNGILRRNEDRVDKIREQVLYP